MIIAVLVTVRLLKLIFFTFFVCLTFNSLGQSLDELRRQKEKTASEIEYINNLLKETNSNAKAVPSGVKYTFQVDGAAQVRCSRARP